MYSKWFHSSSQHYCVFSTVKIFSRPVFSAVLVSEPKTTPTSKFFWKLWCEEIQANQNSKQNGRLVSWTGWHSQFLMSAVRLESWFVEASCSFEPQPRLSFATGLSHLTPLLLSLLLKANNIIITMNMETNLQWEFVCREKWQSSGMTQTGSPHDLKKSASGLENLTRYDPDTSIRHVAWALPASPVKIYN